MYPAAPRPCLVRISLAATKVTTLTDP
jgi:hypothetical protein